MYLRRRSFWVAVAAVLYVAVAALRAGPEQPQTWVGVGVGLVLLLAGWQLVAVPLRRPDQIAPSARSAARVTVTGVAIVAVAQLAPVSPGFVAARCFGLAIASVASLVALARITSLGGIATRDNLSRRFDAAVFASLLWTIALGLAVARIVAPEQTALLGSATVHYGIVAASLGSIGITVMAALRLYAQRRFELGVAERGAAILWLALMCLALGVFAAALAVVEPETIVPFASLAAASCTAAASISQQPALVSRALRTAVALTLLCSPVACVAVVLAYTAPLLAGVILFVMTIAAACLGLVTPRLAQLLAPERGRWLRTLGVALRAAKQPEPQQALVAVFSAIRDGLPRAAPAALYRLPSQDRVVVDRAGYLHTEQADLPERLMELAAEQPLRVLSTEALRSVQVRRAEVRPLVGWLDARSAGALALVFDEQVCVGALLWPAAGRRSPLSFEEIEGMSHLAAHLGVATGAAAQLARSRARELEAQNVVANVEKQLASRQRTIDADTRRRRTLAELLAQPARVACYSPAARTALFELERAGQGGQPAALVVPPGGDGICWSALFHLASARSDGLLFVEDATAELMGSAEGDHEQEPLRRWKDKTRSPLTMARGGTLVLSYADALPDAVQRYVSRALPADFGLVALLGRPHDRLAKQGGLDEHFAALFTQSSIRLPALVDRAEDLRALALHKLSRIGLRLRGRPLGLTMQAQALLNEYSWPGNEAELEAVLLRAALRTEGDVVDREQVDGLVDVAVDIHVFGKQRGPGDRAVS